MVAGLFFVQIHLAEPGRIRPVVRRPADRNRAPGAVPCRQLVSETEHHNDVADFSPAFRVAQTQDLGADTLPRQGGFHDHGFRQAGHFQAGFAV